MEREFTVRRTRARLATAKANGRVGGRPRAMNDAQSQVAPRTMREQGRSVADIAKALKVSVPSVYR